MDINEQLKIARDAIKAIGQIRGQEQAKVTALDSVHSLVAVERGRAYAALAAKRR